MKLTGEKESEVAVSPEDGGIAAEVGYVKKSAVHCKMKEWLREGDTAFGLATVLADTGRSAHMKAAPVNKPPQPLAPEGRNLHVEMLLLRCPKTEKCVGKTLGEGDSEMMMLAVPTPASRKGVGRNQGLNLWEREWECWT